MQITENPWILSESVGCLNLYKRIDSTSEWAFVKGSRNPANAEYSYLSKAEAKAAMLKTIARMVVCNLGGETLLTERQQLNILKKVGLRGNL